MRSDLHKPPPRRGKGTLATSRRTFLTILPPIMAATYWSLEAQPALRTGAAHAVRRRSGRLVYVVDDFQELTDLYRLVLEDSGYGVRTFNDRTAALLAILAEDPRPGLLITDYVGYPISAEELMRACRRTQPDLKILMATGCVESRLVFTHVRPDRFLQKPFAIKQFIAEVRALIGPPHPKERISCKSCERRAYLLML